MTSLGTEWTFKLAIGQDVQRDSDFELEIEQEPTKSQESLKCFIF
jgi:hypothetical protein